MKRILTVDMYSSRTYRGGAYYRQPIGVLRGNRSSFSPDLQSADLGFRPYAGWR